MGSLVSRGPGLAQHMIVKSVTLEVEMRAKSGDRLVVKSHRVGERDKYAEILEVRGNRGEPPYEVRWSEDGHTAVVWPGSDAVIEPKRKRESAGNKHRTD